MQEMIKMQDLENIVDDKTFDKRKEGTRDEPKKGFFGKMRDALSRYAVIGTLAAGLAFFSGAASGASEAEAKDKYSILNSDSSFLEDTGEVLEDIFVKGDEPNQGLAVSLGMATKGENELIYSTGPTMGIEVLTCLTSKICSEFGADYFLYFTKSDDTKDQMSVVDMRFGLLYHLQIADNFYLRFGGGPAAIATNKYLTFDKIKPQIDAGYYFAAELGNSPFSFEFRVLSNSKTEVMNTPDDHMIYPIPPTTYMFMISLFN